MQTKINWFEIPANDFARAVHFYQTVFDTELKVEDFEGGKMATFGQGQEAVGAVIEGYGQHPADGGPVVYLDVTPGMDTVLARITHAGGRIVLDKMALPQDMGYIAHFIDTEGNRLALHAMH